MQDRALIVIDVQQGFDDPSWGRRSNPDFEARVAEALAAARAAGMEVIHVRHLSRFPESPLTPGQPGADFASYAAPRAGELVVDKRVNSAFIGTALEETLRVRGLGRLILIGLTSDHCVSTTARMAANLGFDVTILADATATHDRTSPSGTLLEAELVQEASLASLQGEFARVVDVSTFTQEITRIPVHAYA